jgi:excisionase family DNA binding protein
MERLYSTKQAAEALGGVSKAAVEAWLSKGKLRRTKVGSRTMIRESELERFLRDDDKSPAGPGRPRTSDSAAA